MDHEKAEYRARSQEDGNQLASSSSSRNDSLATSRLEKEDMNSPLDDKDVSPSRSSISIAHDEGKAIEREAKEKSEEQTPNKDLENLRKVDSGPLYSIFSPSQRGYIVFMAAVAGFFSPISSNIYFPALPTLSRTLDVTTEKINLTVTAFLIFQGILPALFGDLADMLGRRPVYIVCLFGYAATNIGLALQTNYTALFVLRCVQAIGSPTIALGSGVVADIATPAERGRFVSYVQMGALLGPAFGPFIGGLLTQYLSWRAIFWFLTISSGIASLLFLFTFPETCRAVVGNGSIPPQPWNISLLTWLAQRRAAKAEGSDALQRTESRDEKRRARKELEKKRNIHFPNPLRSLIIMKEKDVALILLYISLIYTGFYCILSTIPSHFEKIYHLDVLKIGLCYLPFGFGCLISAILNGRLLDWNFRRRSKKLGIAVDIKRGNDLTNFPIESVRIQLVFPSILVSVLSAVIYGWSLEYEWNLSVPLIFLFIIGFSFTGSFNILQTLLIDMFQSQASAATAGINIARCLMGAAGVALIDKMIAAMGLGWCFTFIGLVVGGLTPILWVLLKFGPRWREERRVRLLAKKEKLEEKRREKEGQHEGAAT